MDDKGCCNTSSLRVETAPREDAGMIPKIMSFRLLHSSCGRPLFRDFCSIFDRNDEQICKIFRYSPEIYSNSSPLKNDDWKTIVSS